MSPAILLGPAAVYWVYAAASHTVFIMADDLTSTDAGRYGGTLVETPNIDRLVPGRMRFTHCCSAAAM